MRAKLVPSAVLLCLAVALAPHAVTAVVPPQAPFPQAAGEPACPGNGGLVKADIVALDQAIVLNRLGASLPNGMIFALATDVCAPGGPVIDGQPTCGTGKPSAGKVMLRPGKRPRPLVLRVDQGQCLEITFTNLLNPTAQAVTVPPASAETQPATRAASVHVQGMEWVKNADDDGSWVGANGSSLVKPGDAPHIYTLFAAHEGSFLLYSTGDTYTANAGGDGGTLAFGLFGAVHVEPKGAEWYRSQVTGEDLKLATKGTTPAGQPILDYHAVYPAGHPRAGLPILNLVSCPNEAKEGCPLGGQIVHGDLTAMITGRQPDGQPGPFPADASRAPVFNPAYALPDRLQPYREFTIIYHELYQAVQAFDQMYANSLNVDGNGADNFAFNYGAGGIGSEILANRLGVGPMGNCPSCKYEEFFLTSWAVGDPAMVVDHPATDSCTPTGICDDHKTACDPDLVNPNPACPLSSSTALKNIQAAFKGTCTFTGGYTCTKPTPATRAFYPDDPSNVYHSYMSDHTKFRVLHAGVDLHHVHHQHAHQWLHSPDTPNGYYTDSQTFGPGSAFTLEMVYNGSGNVNQTVGDSIFHCHFYPHFAGGMWSLWRVHDVFEAGTPMRDGRPERGQRALPDGEINAGTPIPGVVPLPSLPMAPVPAPVRLSADGTQYEVCSRQGGPCVSPFTSAALDPKLYTNPGYPFFIPGIAGQRAPHPPLDFAHENPDDPRSATLDGGLPRHIIRGCDTKGGCVSTPPLNAVDFSKSLEKVSAFELPEVGTGVEKLAMAAHGQRFHATFTQERAPKPAQFILNGLPAVPGAPYADPCINYSRAGGKPAGLVTRRYKAADIQLDAVFNKEGWHFPQQRMLALWGDVESTLAGKRAPEPLFFRANSGECIEYTLANLVPNVYELDDFQVRTPTDILGQHIHLVKFDVTSSDGATNGFNYEDGTFSPDEVTERIRAINAGGGLHANDAPTSPQRRLAAKALPFFGPGPGGRWMGAQATIQRWYADPLFDGPRHDPPAPLAVDRTLRTVFTHDHFGPSTHQQAGLYAGLVIEPKGSLWYGNESTGGPFGGVDAAGQPLPGRTVTGVSGPPVRDGGPTTWQAVIETPNKAASFREFVFAVQDTTLTYSPFGPKVVSRAEGQGWCSTDGKSCTPATATKPAAGCSAGVCYAHGFCSNNTALLCKPATWQSDEDVSNCNYAQATCNLIAGIPGQVVAYQPLNVFGPSGKATVLPNIATWGTLPIDPPYKIAAEVITLAGGSNSYSMNYRNEPLYPRIIDPATQKPSTSGTLGDLSYVYTSQPRPWLPVAGPYPPLTRDVGPGDPFTPLMRSYAGDDVQVRTLVTGQINPHNLAIHGVHWLSQPGWDDSGWRGSQVMGISEHFEQIFRLPSWVSLPTTGGSGKQADYLMMAGAANTEQAGGNWSLLRAYGERRNDLRALPQNPNPEHAASLPVCPASPKPPHQNRTYTVVALSGSLTYTSLQGGITDPNAILYSKLEDLNCPGGTPSASCTPRSSTPAPLVLRANAGDCITVTLYNFATASNLPAGAPAPNLPAAAQTNPPTFALTCAANVSGVAPCLPSNTSPSVGLHPQLATFNAAASDGFNVGANPVQTVTIGGKPATYTWYAGNVDVRNPVNPYIPIELGASNLLPSDVVNHYQHGLFGALVIEPEGATGWTAADGIEAHVKPATGPAFHEFVLATQDGMDNPPSPAASLGSTPGGGLLTAINYKSMVPNFSGIACTTAGDVSCLFSNTAQCCSTALVNGACPSGSSVACNQSSMPLFTACAGEPVRFRLVHPGGHNLNQVFEIYGHVWTETPYESVGLGCAPQTTQTNLYASSIVSNQRGCTAAQLSQSLPAANVPLASIITNRFLASYGAQRDSLSIWQGSRSGHGPSNHFDVLIEKAGGSNAVPGDYLLRTYPADQLDVGLWGIFRVQSCRNAETTTPANATTAAEGGSR